VLQVEPWSGGPYDRQRADANMRTHAAGKHGEGLVIYLIFDDQRLCGTLMSGEFRTFRRPRAAECSRG
jgi:hypothetical protein